MDNVYMSGIFIMQAMVILVNFKITVSTHNHTFFSIFCQLFGIISFYAFFYLEADF